MMAAETHIQCSTFASGHASTSDTTTSDKNLAQRIMEHSTEMGFAVRAVKTSAHATSFIATQDGQRLGVSTGSQSVKSMRRYLRSNNQEDIHGGCDWTVLSCTPTTASYSGKQTTDPENLQFCIAATEKGSTCATTVCRGNGSIAYHSQPTISCVETNFFYAQPNDYVMLHSVKSNGAASSQTAASAAQEMFQSAVRHAAEMRATSSSNSVLDVESLTESVLESLNQHGEEASTVVIARLGYVNSTATQPPATA